MPIIRVFDKEPSFLQKIIIQHRERRLHGGLRNPTRIRLQSAELLDPGVRLRYAEPEIGLKRRLDAPDGEFLIPEGLGE